VGELRSQLEARAAQQAVIEAEIARQLDDYGRLKQQLLNQEELQVGGGMSECDAQRGPTYQLQLVSNSL
jgi:hypothetical protein